MFKITESNDSKIIKIEVSGKITGDDYHKTLRPYLDVVKDCDEKMRLLCITSDDFEGYSVDAVWEDAKLSIHHFNSFEKIAIVSDISWVVNSCKFFSPVVPCAVKVFPSKDIDKAKAWLESGHTALTCDLDPKTGIAEVEIKDPLATEDFKILSKTLDPWIENNGELIGLLLHSKNFPHWENFGGFISHLSFIKNHHRKIEKLAIVADGFLPNHLLKFTNHFTKAQVKHFDYKEMEGARDWLKN